MEKAASSRLFLCARTNHKLLLVQWPGSHYNTAVNQFNPKEYILVGLVASLSTLVMIFAPTSIELLRYESLSVSQGEWWRLFTANFTHSSWNHWMLNFAGLLLIDYLFQPLIKQAQRAALLLFSMALNVFLLHLTMNLSWYVGLSGALHGFLVGAALLSFSRARLFNGLIILVVSAKLALELSSEINQGTASFIGANVVEEAHLAGAISGVVYLLLLKTGGWSRSHWIARTNKKAHH